MATTAKTEQLQIRLSPARKAELQRSAARAGLDVSAYVLARASSPAAEQFAQLVQAAGREHGRFALAELNTLLSCLTAGELQEAIAGGIPHHLGAQLANTLAAMVEIACSRCGVACPKWTRQIAPLPEPVFGSALLGLRLYLLTRSPAAFRRRNLFVDATLDDQV